MALFALRHARVFRTSIRIVSVLFTGTIITSALVFVSQILLARMLPSRDYGALAALLAMVNFLTPVGSAGVNWFLLQVVGRERWQAMRWLPACTGLVAIATGVSCLTMASYVLCSDISRIGPAIVLGAAIPILLGQIAVELASSRFQLEERFCWLTFWQASTQGGRFVVVIGGAIAGVPLSAILAGYAAVGASTTAVGIALLRTMRTGTFHLAGVEPTAASAEPAPRTSLRQAAIEAGPFALVTMFYVIYCQGGIVILDWLAGGVEAATYNAGYLIIAAVSLIPNVIYMKFLIGKICRWAEHDPPSFRAAFHLGVPAMTGLGVVVGMATGIVAPFLMPLVFGHRFDDAGTVVVILSLATPIRFAQSAYSSVFVSRTEINRKVGYLGISAMVSILASFCLIPVSGVIGAAVANVLAEITLLALHVRGTARHIAGIDIRDTLRISTLKSSLRQFSQRPVSTNDTGNPEA